MMGGGLLFWPGGRVVVMKMIMINKPWKKGNDGLVESLIETKV